MAESHTGNAPRPRRMDRIRGLLLLPPGLLVVAAIVLLVISPFAWGAGSPVEMSAWMPPLAGIAVAVGALLVGLSALRKTARATRGDFEVFGLQVAFGILMFIAGAASLLSLADRLPHTGTYESFLDDDGQPGAHPAFYFAFTLILGAVNLAWVWAGSYLYTHAIANQEPNRISRRDPNEVDGVGALLRERR